MISAKNRKRKPLLSNVEIVAAVNRIFWENAHLSICDINAKFREAGYPSNARSYIDRRDFENLVDNVRRNAPAVRAELFWHPDSIRGVRRFSGMVKDCDLGKRCDLIYFSVIHETAAPEGGLDTLLLVFRKPRTNTCVPYLVSCRSDGDFYRAEGVDDLPQLALEEDGSDVG